MALNAGRGIVLVLISGVLTLGALLATLFIQSARVSRAMSGAAIEMRSSALSAASGLQYAGARLVEDSRLWGYPRNFPTAESRADDWSFRDPFETPLKEAKNPSYSHGEHWTDSVADGVYVPGTDAFMPPQDRDGDGRFSAWSGRLRGAGGSPALPFTLKVVSLGGLVPLNYGATYAPFHNDLLVYNHQGLAHLLNNLGALLLAPNPAIGRLDVPASGGPVAISRLGEHLIEGRPENGYDSERKVKDVLLRNLYSPPEIDAILPYLDIGPHESMVESGRLEEHALLYMDLPLNHCAVELSTTPLPMLKAHWMYLGAPRSDWLELRSALDLPFPRAGGAVTYAGTEKVMIYPDEADLLASLADRFRRADNPQRVSWLAFRRALVAESPTIFQDEASPLIAADEETGADWIRAKADLAFFGIGLDVPASGGMLSSWTHWGIDHGGAMPVPACRPFEGIDFWTRRFQRLPYPDFNGNWPEGPDTPHLANPGQTYTGAAPQWMTHMWPLPMTMGSATRFRIESLAGGSAAAGALRVAERLEFTSEEDFENFQGGSRLWKERRIKAIDPDPTQKRPAFVDPVVNLFTDEPEDPSPAYPGVVSLTYWNVAGFPHPDDVVTLARAYPRDVGALALATRACGNQGASQYGAFTEDWASTDPENEVLFTPWWDPVSSIPPFNGLPRPLPENWTDYTHFHFQSDGNFVLGKIAEDPTTYGYFEYPGLTDSLNLQPFSIELFDGLNMGWEESEVFPLIRLTATQVGKKTFGLVNLDRRMKEDPMTDSTGYEYTLKMQWHAKAGSDGPFDGDELEIWEYKIVAFIPRYDPATGRTLQPQNHVAVVFEQTVDPALPYTLTLYVNGTRFGPAAPDHVCEEKPKGFKGIPFDDRRLVLTFNADELRLYSFPLSEQDVQDRIDLGRFIVPDNDNPPTYTSPLYQLDAPARILKANWTGIPEGAHPDEQDRVRMEVVVHGYSDLNGSTIAPGFPRTLDETLALSDLKDTGRVLSFRYQVRFLNNTGSLLPLFRTPYFESIWFMLQGRDRTPVWME